LEPSHKIRSPGRHENLQSALPYTNPAIMAVGGDVVYATEKLQTPADEITNWTQQWLIKFNEDKSIHVSFTNKRCHHVPVIMSGKTIPHSQTAKCLGMSWHDAGCQVALEGPRQKKERDDLGLKHNTCTGPWVEDRPCPRTTTWCFTNRY